MQLVCLDCNYEFEGPEFALQDMGLPCPECGGTYGFEPAESQDSEETE